jgi:hypothetical protein
MLSVQLLHSFESGTLEPARILSHFADLQDAEFLVKGEEPLRVQVKEWIGVAGAAVSLVGAFVSLIYIPIVK